VEEDVAAVVVLVVVVAVAMVVVVGVAVDLRDLHPQVVQVPKHSKQHWLAQQVDVDVEVVVERAEAEAPRQPAEVVAEMLANPNSKLNRCPLDDGHTTSSLAQNQPEVDNNKSNLDEH